MFSSFWHPVPPTVQAPRPCPPESLFLKCQGTPGKALSANSRTCLIAASLETRDKVGVTGVRLQFILHQFWRPLEVPHVPGPHMA